MAEIRQALISKEEAIARGLKRFFTGQPCRRGHIAERYTSGACVECLDVKAPRDYAWTSAKALGLKRYFTGKPCKYGHIAERSTSNGMCVRCGREKDTITKIKYRALVRKVPRAQSLLADGIMSRSQAKSLGYRQYFTGKPCCNGHLAPRYTLNTQCVQCRRDWLSANKEHVADYKKKTRKPPTKAQLAAKAAKSRERYQREHERLLEIARGSRARGIQKRWHDERIANDVAYRLKITLRKRISKILRTISGSPRYFTSNELTGCSAEQLVMHLERQFIGRMGWKNYGRLWEVDHIIPCSKFDLDDPEQQKACFHFTNLRPLRRERNRAKSNHRELLL